MVETYFGCILPEEWLVYSYDLLEAAILKKINESWRCFQTLGGLVFTIKGVRTMIFDYNNQLWFRRVNDTEEEPNRDYFMLYLNLDIL